MALSAKTMNDKYLDLKTLSVYSSLSIRTIRDYLADRENPLPSFCIKRKILVKKSEFDTWIKRYRTDSKLIDRIADDVLKNFERLDSE